MDAFIYMRKQEREILRRISIDRNLNTILQRMVRDDYGFSGDKILRKRVCRQNIPDIILLIQENQRCLK